MFEVFPRKCRKPCTKDVEPWLHFLAHFNYVVADGLPLPIAISPNDEVVNMARVNFDVADDRLVLANGSLDHGNLKQGLNLSIVPVFAGGGKLNAHHVAKHRSHAIGRLLVVDCVVEFVNRVVLRLPLHLQAVVSQMGALTLRNWPFDRISAMALATEGFSATQRDTLLISNQLIFNWQALGVLGFWGFCIMARLVWI